MTDVSEEVDHSALAPAIGATIWPDRMDTAQDASETGPTPPGNGRSQPAFPGAPRNDNSRERATLSRQSQGGGPRSHSDASRIERLLAELRSKPALGHAFVGAVLLIALIISTFVDGTLWGYRLSPLELTIHPVAKTPQVRLPLLLDVEGIVFIVGGLAAPLLCVWQAKLIRLAAEASSRNAIWMSPPSSEVREATKKANERFRLIGSKRASVVHLCASVFVTIFLYALIAHYGPLQAWNPTTDLPASKWGALVYDGWWANWSHHTASTVILMLISVNYVYYAFKTLAMGYVVALYSRRLAKSGCAVVPDLQANRDGYWGLRDFWTLVRAAYLSTLLTWCGIIGLFWLWLPFRPWTVLVVLVLGCVTLGGVAHPTVLAHKHIVEAKKTYVKRLLAHDTRHADAAVSAQWPGQLVRERIAEIWALPDLPFRARSWLAALATYVLIPLAVALLSTLLFPSG